MIRLGYIIALVGLAAVTIEAIYPRCPFILFSVYFAVCWMLWLVCAWRQDSSITALVGLWILIDTAVLIELTAFEHTYGHGPLSGAEYLYLFSFAPVIVPSGLLLGMFAGVASKWPLWGYLGPATAYVAPEWIEMTVIAVTQSFAVAVIGRSIRKKRLSNSK
jgi:hypothetical protein